MGRRPRRRRRGLRRASFTRGKFAKFAPYPELVEPESHPEPYRIGDSNEIEGLPTNGMTNKEERELIVPLDATNRVVSLHELAHVKWSPEKWPRLGYNPNVFLAVEDARINGGLEEISLGLDVERADRVRIAGLAQDDLERSDYGMLILRGIASIGTTADDIVLETLEGAPAPIRELGEQLIDFVRDKLTAAARRAKAPVAPDRVVRRVAREVARRLEAYELIEKGQKGSVAEVEGCLVCGPPKGPLVDGQKGSPLDRYLGEPPEGTGDLDAGVMEIARPKLPVRIVDGRRAVARRWRPSGEGSVVTNVHRWSLDRAIFRRPGRRPGGTILIDTSGSMRLSPEQIDALVRVSRGAALVAMYSGSGDEGELRIIAENGKRARIEDLEPYGSGNIVDLPALERLGGQSQPRIWISDGNVSGIGDRASKSIRIGCDRARQQHAIERIDSVSVAIERLGGTVPEIPDEDDDDDTPF